MKAQKKKKLKLITLKVFPNEHRKMKAIAKKETRGNLSLLIRKRLLSKAS